MIPGAQLDLRVPGGGRWIATVDDQTIGFGARPVYFRTPGAALRAAIAVASRRARVQR